MRIVRNALFAVALGASATTATSTKADTTKQMTFATEAIEMWSSGDTSQVGQIFKEAYQNHQAPDIRGGPRSIDLEEWKATVDSFQTGFPNISVEILEQLAEGPLVSTRWRFTGVQEGEYLGVAPSGKTITWTGIQIDRFEDGKIAETWVNWDMYSMFKELGLIE